MSVWADGPWMLDGGLAADLAAALAAEPAGLSCDELAARLHRRRTDVLTALRADPRFDHSGRSRGSRWRLGPALAAGTEWDGGRSEDRPFRDRSPVRPADDGRRPYRTAAS